MTTFKLYESELDELRRKFIAKKSPKRTRFDTDEVFYHRISRNVEKRTSKFENVLIRYIELKMKVKHKNIDTHYDEVERAYIFMIKK